MPNKEPNQKSSIESDSDIKKFDIRINEFGEVVCSHTMDDLNSYLDDKVDDKKLSPNEVGHGTNKPKE